MKFTIVTPSLNQLEFLKRNVASVRDQEGVDVEHVVQDAGSTDGTAEWIGEESSVEGVVENDEGMYDAINRGIARGKGDVFAWLNCDEQYLPGALRDVAEFFEANPEVDIVFGHTVVVDADGNYICHRKAVVPGLNLLRLAFLPVHSSSMFFRRRVVGDDMLFDTRWKVLGDWDWVLRAKRRGSTMKVIDRFISCFADTGDNLDLSPNAIREKRDARATTPLHLKLLRPAIRGAIWGGKLVNGHYRQAPFHYEIYATGTIDSRTTFEVENPTFVWKSRMLKG